MIVYRELDLLLKVNHFSHGTFAVVIAQRPKLGQQMNREVTHDDLDPLFLLQIADEIVLGRADDLRVEKTRVQMIDVVGVCLFLLNSDASNAAQALVQARGDVAPALETKVIDGLATSLGGFNSTKDQAPYFTVAGINGVVGDYYWIGASNKWWNKLNKPTQEIIEKLLVEKVIPFQKAANWCYDKRVLDKYKTEDKTKPGIYVLKPEEAAGFQEKLGDKTADWVKTKTPGDAHKLVDDFVREARAASKAHPLGSDPLEKTDCAEYEPWFARYAKKK